jgi:hypothetical protein
MWVSRLTLAAAFLAITFSAAAWGSGSQTAEHREQRCGPHGQNAFTLKRSHRARVLDHHGDVEACLFSVRRVWSLTPVLRGDWSSADTEIAFAFRFSGPVVAYGYDHTFDDDCKRRVRVMDLRTGKVMRSTVPGKRHYRRPEFADPPPCDPSPKRIVVKHNGAVAWASVELRSDRPSWHQVYRWDGRGRELLDEGPEVAPGSLRRRGSRVTWRAAGRIRSASLH